jgi:hypothetical protein
VDQLPGGVSQPEERPAVIELQKVAVGVHAYPRELGRRTWADSP